MLKEEGVPDGKKWIMLCCGKTVQCGLWASKFIRLQCRCNTLSQLDAEPSLRLQLKLSGLSYAALVRSTGSAFCGACRLFPLSHLREAL